MLPSTFAEKHQKEEAIRNELRARIELAQFLQQTVEQVRCLPLKVLTYAASLFDCPKELGTLP